MFLTDEQNILECIIFLFSLPKKLGYKVHRNDKRSDCGGVLIAVQECHSHNEVYNKKQLEWYKG